MGVVPLMRASLPDPLRAPLRPRQRRKLAGTWRKLVGSVRGQCAQLPRDTDRTELHPPNMRPEFRQSCCGNLWYIRAVAVWTSGTMMGHARPLIAALAIVFCLRHDAAFPQARGTTEPGNFIELENAADLGAGVAEALLDTAPGASAAALLPRAI